MVVGAIAVDSKRSQGLGGTFTAAIVGIPFDGITGSVALFDTTTGEQIDWIWASDGGAANDEFGSAVAIHGVTAIVGSPLDDDLGSASGSAYLFDATTCAADISGDGTVGPADLAVILGKWGPVPPNDPSADLNADGMVGPADLAILLRNWGPFS